MNTKSLLGVLFVALLIFIGVYFFLYQPSEDKYNNPTPTGQPVATTTVEEIIPPGEASTTEPVAKERGDSSTIGQSAGGEDIKAYHFGDGSTELLFIGGIHGGYSWSTALVAYQLIDYLKANPDLVPENVTVTVIPAFNADGLMATVKTTGVFKPSAVPKDEASRIAGRFNENNVDLNRNFDCQWQATGKWQNRDVSGGSAAFSEPESAALRDYVEAHRPTAVVAWYSAAGGVYSSNCNNGVSTETAELLSTYADASGYKAYKEFNYYEITGDMMNWFAKLNVPAISVLLSTHESTEWEKNKAGIDAVLASYAR